MNRHFMRGDQRPTLDGANAMFAQIERAEPPFAPGAPWLVTLDAIGANWLLAQASIPNQPYFNFANRAAMKAARRDGRQLRFNGQRVNPFDAAPLFRIELELQNWWSPQPPWFDDDPAAEKLWFDVRIDASSKLALPANIYSNAFLPPMPAMLTFQRVFGEMETALAELVSLEEDFEEIGETELEDLLRGRAADALGIYHVGQGNANGLLGSSSNCKDSAVSIYYDLGCGVYANRGTTPAPLTFCLDLKPPVVLSHWDSDHWMGAYAHEVPPGSANYPCLDLNWVAPLQNVTTHHKTFALDVASHGSMRIYRPTSPGAVGTVSLGSPSNTTIQFTAGTGPRRNHSGIVLSVERDMRLPSGNVHSWLLTGDCDYMHFWKSLSPPNLVGMVVPHHGAARPKSHSTPPPVGGAIGQNALRPYRRLGYSFGAGNKQAYGVVHPVDATVTEHLGSGWDCLPWQSGLNVGNTYPGLDTRATAQHVVPGADGILVGWTAPPTLPFPACASCTTRCGQN
jgi:hypothetical protein